MAAVVFDNIFNSSGESKEAKKAFKERQIRKASNQLACREKKKGFENSCLMVGISETKTETYTLLGKVVQLIANNFKGGRIKAIGKPLKKKEHHF